MPASTAIATFFAPAPQAAAGAASSPVSKTDNDGVFTSLVEEVQSNAATQTNPLLSLIAGPDTKVGAVQGVTSVMSPEMRNLLATLKQGTQKGATEVETPVLPSDLSALPIQMIQYQQLQPAHANGLPPAGIPPAAAANQQQLQPAQANGLPPAGIPPAAAANQQQLQPAQANGLPPAGIPPAAAANQQQLQPAQAKGLPPAGIPPAAAANQQRLQAATGQDPAAILDALAGLAAGNGTDALDPTFAQMIQTAATTSNSNTALQAKAAAAPPGGEAPLLKPDTADAQGLLQVNTTDTRSAIAHTGQGQSGNMMQNGSSGSADLAKPFDLNLQAASTQGLPHFQVELTKVQQTVTSGPILPQVPLETLAVQIARRFEKGMSSFEISLSPAELGKLDISMQVSDDGRVQAVIRAERPETLELLKQDARALETQLRQAGLDVGSNALSFQLSHGNAHRQNSAAREGGFSSAQDDNQETEQATSSYAATRKRDGLDIHV